MPEIILSGYKYIPQSEIAELKYEPNSAFYEAAFIKFSLTWNNYFKGYSDNFTYKEHRVGHSF